MTAHIAVSEPLCDMCEILSATRRCHVIRFLAKGEITDHSVRDVAKQLTATEQDVPVAEATGDPYSNVRTALLQTHLPTLAEAGIIRYDANQRVVQRGDQFQVAVLLLTVAQTTYRTMQQTAV
jgi:hypothetical protein